MSIANIQRGGAIKPPITVIHGSPGIGKTTWAASAQAPVIIRTEDGLGSLDIDAFPVSGSYGEVIDAITALYQEEHSYQTVIIDSLSALEPLIWAHVAAMEGKPNIEAIGYGKGYTLAMDYWVQILQGMAALRDDRGMMPILIAHSEVVRFDSPEVDPYERYMLALHKRALALIYERADIIGFAAWKVHAVQKEVGFNQKVTRGIGTGERLLHLVEKPAYLAKNRYALPETLPLSWPAFADAMAAATKRKPN